MTTDLRDVEPIYEHPAKFNDEILLRIAAAISDHTWFDFTNVLDPFGGIGGIHLLRPITEGYVNTTYAIELQPGWARASAERGWTFCGDLFEFSPTTSQFQYRYESGSWVDCEPPGQFGTIATSCTYGNRMADKHNAREDSKRMTYAHTLRRNGEEMDPDNSGGMQWGHAYRTFHEAAWNKCRFLLRPGGLFILNVKDHIRGGKIVQVSKWHRDTLIEMGLELVDDIQVPVRGMGFGQNQTLQEGLKVDYEHIYVLRKAA